MFRFLFDIDTWQEVSDSLTKNKIRTVITMIGVWWGILLLIGLLGSTKGIENKFNSQFGDFATNSVFVWPQSTSKPFKGFQEGRLPRLKYSQLEKIRNNIEGIELVVPRNNNQAQVVRNLLSGSFGVVGDFPILDEVQKKNLVSGRWINQNDIDNNKKVTVITDDVYKQLFQKDEEAVGQYITINKINFKVIGVYKEGDWNFGGSIHIPFTTFQQTYNQGDNIGWMIITAKPEYNILQIEKDVKLLLRNMNKVHPNDNRAFGSFNLGERFEQLTGFLTGMQFLTWFVGISTLIAGVFAIGNILLITVKERTKEIGIRRALGATPFEIKRQIVLEAVFLTIIAGIFGIISGGWILILLDNLFGQGPDSVLVNASVSILVVFISLIILVIFGALIGLIPASRATKIKPIEALREE